MPSRCFRCAKRAGGPRAVRNSNRQPGETTDALLAVTFSFRLPATASAASFPRLLRGVGRAVR